MGGRGAMTTAPISLQDLQRRLYVKAKAEKDWRFWGLYVHVGKLETLRAAYDVAKENHGAPGIDGVTFEAIEDAGVERFLVELRDELATRTYRPLRTRRVAGLCQRASALAALPGRVRGVAAPLPAPGSGPAEVPVQEQAGQSGLDGDRPVRDALRLGPLPADQGGGQTPLPARPRWL